MQDDVMHMRPVIGGVVIPADGHVDLSPGRYHLMLVDLSLDIKDGNYIPLTLHFQHSDEFNMNVSDVQVEQMPQGIHPSCHCICQIASSYHRISRP